MIASGRFSNKATPLVACLLRSRIRSSTKVTKLWLASSAEKNPWDPDHVVGPRGVANRPSNLQRRNQNRGPPRSPPRNCQQASKDWLHVTKMLLGMPVNTWTPAQKREAQDCLHHWSLTYMNNHDPSIILNLWDRARHEVPELETTQAMYDHAIKALAKHGRANEAADALQAFCTTEFKHRMTNRWYHPHSYHLNAVLHALAKQKQPERAEAILMDMYRTGAIMPNAYSVTSVIDAWSRSRQAQKAEDLLQHCLSQGLEPSIICYNAVMKAWAHDRSKDAPQKAQALMKSLPVAPDPHTWSTYLVACRDPTLMEQVLWQAFRGGEQVNTIAFNVVLHAWGKIGKVDQAEQFLENWLEKALASPEIARTWLPDLETFNTLLNAFAKRGASDKAEHWLARMKGMGIKPDSHTHNTVIDSLAKAGMAQKAQKYWEEHSPFMDDRNKLLGGNSALSSWTKYAKQKIPQNEKDIILSSAVRFVNNMMASGVKPDLITYNSLMRITALCGSLNAAEALLVEMQGGATKPDEYSFSALIEGYTLQGNPQQAHRVLRTMTIKPNVIAFNMVIKSYAAAPGSLKEVAALLEEMEAAGVDRDLKTYISVLIYCKASTHPDKVKMACQTIDEMKRDFPRLSPRFYYSKELLASAQTMVIATCATSRPESQEEAERYHRICHQTMSEVAIPDHACVATYIQALHNLVRNKDQLEKEIREVFLDYCKGTRQIDHFVIRRLKEALPFEVHTDLITEGEKVTR